MKFKRSSLMTKIIVLVPILAATVTLVSLQAQWEETQARAAALEDEVAAAAQENQRLEAAIAEIGTEAGIKNIARQELGLVEDGEIIFYDIGG